MSKVSEESADPATRRGLTPLQAAGKRAFDILFAAIGLALTSWLIALAWFVATIDTGANGIFTQRRVGQDGRPFTIFKIRTMRSGSSASSVTVSGDPRVTHIGRIWRKLKIDELPQLLNVLTGQMSFVGPRPDVPGFADKLQGEDRIILTVRPGITGPATLKYRYEEELLASVADPDDHNREVIFPDKLRLNREYVENWSFARDIHYIWATISGRRDA
ncbi:MAG: sugar transferase [Rhodothermales bacterium]|nr:sugar transferase [Rhodothermales bacterium]